MLSFMWNPGSRHFVSATSSIFAFTAAFSNFENWVLLLLGGAELRHSFSHTAGWVFCCARGSPVNVTYSRGFSGLPTYCTDILWVRMIHPPVEPRCFSSWPFAGLSSYLNPVLGNPWQGQPKRWCSLGSVGPHKCHWHDPVPPWYRMCPYKQTPNVHNSCVHDSPSLWVVRFVPGARGSISLLALKLAEQRSIAALFLFLLYTVAVFCAFCVAVCRRHWHTD